MKKYSLGDLPIIAVNCSYERPTGATTEVQVGRKFALVAESWSGSEDASVWTFTVRDGCTFSTGVQVTAEDVMKTMERHSNEDSKSGALGIMTGIKSMRTEGNSFICELETGNADLPFLMADYHLIIQPNVSVASAFEVPR